MSGELVFEARGITKVYELGEVKVHALRGVDLDLHAGELITLLGASGSGKSVSIEWAAVQPSARLSPCRIHVGNT